MNRRSTLKILGAGTGAAVGLSSFAGSAAAWERNDVDFKGCSAVWMIVAKEDIEKNPPTVAHVIVETADGGLDCRPEWFTPETTTTVPGQYGDAPVLKHTVEDGEKVLGVILYNYTSDEDDPFKRDDSPLRANPNRCAHTPGTPDPFEATCVTEKTFNKTSDILDGNQGSNGKKHSDGNGKGEGSNGKKHSDGNGKGEGSNGKKNGKERGESDGNGNGKKNDTSKKNDNGNGRGKSPK